MEFLLAGEYSCEAERMSKKLVAALEAMEYFLGREYEAGDEIPWDLIKEDVQTAYISAIEVALNMQKMMGIIGEVCKEESCQMLSGLPGECKTVVTFNSDIEALSVRIMAPPILKKQAVARRYLELICPEVGQKIVSLLPENFKPLKSAYVIFINHFSEKATGKQPYYDNDNIAIKRILDAIVPCVCCDDAYRFCDNLYLAQPDFWDYSEVVVVPKGQIRSWLRMRDELEFSKEFGEKMKKL